VDGWTDSASPKKDKKNDYGKKQQKKKKKNKISMKPEAYIKIAKKVQVCLSRKKGP